MFRDTLTFDADFPEFGARHGVGFTAPGGVVSIDYGNGIRQAVDHVVGLGHRHVALITGPLEPHSARTRRQAFVGGMRQHKLTPEPQNDQGRDADRRRWAEGDGRAITSVEAADCRRLFERLDGDRGLARDPLRPACVSPKTFRSSASTTSFQALFGLISEERVEGDVYQVPTRLVVRQSMRSRARSSSLLVATVNTVQQGQRSVTGNATAPHVAKRDRVSRVAPWLETFLPGSNHRSAPIKVLTSGTTAPHFVKRDRVSSVAPWLKSFLPG